MSQPVFNTELIKLLLQPDAVLQADATTFYLGFCQPGTHNTAEAKWAICKLINVGVIGSIMTKKWSNGTKDAKDQVFDDYASLTYKFLI